MTRLVWSLLKPRDVVVIILLLRWKHTFGNVLVLVFDDVFYWNLVMCQYWYMVTHWNGSDFVMIFLLVSMLWSTQNEEKSKINNENNNHSAELFISLRACSMLISRWGCAAPINEHDLLKVMHHKTWMSHVFQQT